MTTDIAVFHELLSETKLLDQEIAQYPPFSAQPPLPPTPSDATYGGMDPWQSSVEARLGQLHGSVEKLSEKIDSNFKWLIGAYAAGFVVLAGMMVSGYLLLAGQIGQIAH